MARRLSYSARLRFSPEKLYEAQRERQYWQDLADGFRMRTPLSELDELTVGPDGIRVVLKQTFTRDLLPPLAQTVLSKDVVITRTETLGRWRPKVTAGTYTASIPAGPGSLTGEQQLVLHQLADLFRAEAEYSKSWVGKHLS